MIRYINESMMIRKAVRQYRNWLWAIHDRKLNIHTGIVSNTTTYHCDIGALHRDSRIYEPADYSLLYKIFRIIKLTSDDKICDVGCGMGRIPCVAASLGVKHAYGIELDRDLADIAIENAENLRRPHSPITILVGDAALADYSEYSIIFLFNPFGATTMESVVSRIVRSLSTHPRRVRIVYYHPAENAVLARSGHFGLRRTIRSIAHKHVTEIWSTS